VRIIQEIKDFIESFLIKGLIIMAVLIMLMYFVAGCWIEDIKTFFERKTNGPV